VQDKQSKGVKTYIVSAQKRKNLGIRMKKAIVGIGTFALIIGILLVALPFVYVPKTVSESYQVPKTSSVIDESFVVQPSTVTHTKYLNAGDSLNIQVTVTSGGNKDIDFSINDGATTYISYSRVTTVNKDWTVPLSSNYNFVYDNSFSWITSKDVTVQVTKHWTETAYRDVTTSNQLLPFEFAYLGVIAALTGIGLIVFGIVKRDTPKTP
jgi:hypothetical protein